MLECYLTIIYLQITIAIIDSTDQVYKQTYPCRQELLLSQVVRNLRFITELIREISTNSAITELIREISKFGNANVLSLVACDMRRPGSKKLLVLTIIGTSDRRGKHLPSPSLPSPHYRTEPSFPGDSQCSVRST